jgi:hypothetical protein
MRGKHTTGTWVVFGWEEKEQQKTLQLTENNPD